MLQVKPEDFQPPIPVTEDGFRRRVSYLRVSVTDKCNLHCGYCMPLGKMDFWRGQEHLTREELFSLLEAFVTLGVTKVRLTGGEPLLRPDLAQIVAFVNGQPSINDIALSTNGLLLPTMAPALYQAGLRRINISLDTFDPERFRQISGKGNLQQVLQGIQQTLHLGFRPIKINCVIMRGINDDEIGAFARFAYEHPVEVRFIELMPTRYTEEGRSGVGRQHFISSQEVQTRVEAHVSLELEAPRTGVAMVYAVAGGAGSIGFISPVSNHFCGDCNRLRLTSTGMLKTCLHGQELVDLRTPLRSGASTQDIAAIIRGAVMRKPEEHFFRQDRFISPTLQMSQVGG